jgi:DNA polymerase IV
MFMHIDMDAFFASVEQVINPGFKGKPLVVGSRDNKFHTVVCAASYEARAYGIDSGMPSAQAFKLCPHAQFVAADSAKYVYTSRKIHEILQGFSPQIEYLSVDEFVLSPDGLELIFGPPEEMARKIKDEIRREFSLACSIGIAQTRIMAKLASKLAKPDGLLTVQNKGFLELLTATPVEKLCGVGPALKQGLNDLGVFSCLELLKTPSNLLSQRFGKVGLWLYESVRLHSQDSPVGAVDSPKEPPKSIGHSYTLPKAISQKSAVLAWIRLLSEMVSVRLRQQNLGAKTVYLNLGSKGANLAKQKTFFEPTFDGLQIYQRCLSILSQSNLIKLSGVKFVAVSTSNLSLPERPFLFPEENRREALISTLDRINQRFGDWTVFPAILSPIKDTL